MQGDAGTAGTTGEDQISLTDPDSRAMAAHTRVAVGYNVQVAVDAKHKLIVEQQVTNQVVDMGLLTQTAEPAKEVLGVETDRRSLPTRVTSRSRISRPARKPGWCPTCRARSAVPRSKAACFARTSSAMTRPATVSLSGGSAPASLFVFSSAGAEEDQLCQQAGLPGLRDPVALHGWHVSHGVSSGERSRVGPDAGSAGDSVPMSSTGAARRSSIPFGTIKQWMNQGAFLMRGLEKVRAEFSLTALAYNLRRVLNIVGFTELMAAVAA